MGAIKLDPSSLKKRIKKAFEKLVQPKKQPQLVLQPVRPRPRFFDR